MKDFNIEGYLEGGLTESELKAFEAEMQKNTALAKEVDFYRNLTKDIEIAGIRNEVSAALSDLDSPKPEVNWTKYLGGGLVLILVISFLFFWKNAQDNQTVLPVKIEAETETVLDTSEIYFPPIIENKVPGKEEKTIEKQDETKSQNKRISRPIAENKTSPKLAPPLFPPPNIRGEQEDNKEWKSFLNKVWYTEYPPKGMDFQASFAEVDSLLKKRDFESAYVPLLLMEENQSENDTFQFLKAYCLLEMGEGAEAQRYLENLENTPLNWEAHVEWYSGLSFLIAGKREEAILIFQGLSDQPNHRFHQQAKKTLQLFK